MKFTLINFFLWSCIISCAQKNKYDLNNYVEYKRGPYKILSYVIFYRDKIDSNYVALKDYNDSLYTQPVSLYFYYKDVLQGPYQIFDSNGKLYQNGFYNQGKEDGERQTFDGNLLVQKAYFKNGQKNGLWETYNKKGKLIRRTKYENNGIISDETFD